MDIRYSRMFVKAGDKKEITIRDFEKGREYRFNNNMDDKELNALLDDLLFDINAMFNELNHLKHNHNDKLYKSLCEICKITSAYKEYELNTNFTTICDNFRDD